MLRQHRLGKTLVVLEMMLTVVLLGGAGLLIRSVEWFASAPLGFAPDHLATARITLRQSNYVKADRRLEFYDRLLNEARAVPQIEGAAATTAMPIQGSGAFDILAVEARPDPSRERTLDTIQQTVTPEYFSVMQLALQRGRLFGPDDREQTEPVAIINQALAEKYFPGEDPVGKRIRAFWGNPENNPWLRIAGAVANEKRMTVYQEMGYVDWPTVYRPLRQNVPNSAIVLVRTTVGQSDIGPALQRKIATLDPNVAIGRLDPVAEAVSKVLAYPRFRAILLTAFAAIALLLTVIGLCGVLSHLVAHRTQEIAIRIALGAQRKDVLAMVLHQGLQLSAAGLLCGVAATFALHRYVSALLYGTGAPDPILVGSISFGWGLIALAAMCPPALRATRIDPMTALRRE